MRRISIEFRTHFELYKNNLNNHKVIVLNYTLIINRNVECGL